MNLYKITVKKIENSDNIISARTHYVEAENYSKALNMINELYSKFEDASIVDISNFERIAKDIIHTK